MGDGARPEVGIVVADTHPFKAQDTWVDGRAGVPESIKDAWDFGHDCLPHCLECNEEFERRTP
jgi:hypothetical protein